MAAPIAALDGGFKKRLQRAKIGHWMVTLMGKINLCPGRGREKMNEIVIKGISNWTCTMFSYIQNVPVP